MRLTERREKSTLKNVTGMVASPPLERARQSFPNVYVWTRPIFERFRISASRPNRLQNFCSHVQTRINKTEEQIQAANLCFDACKKNNKNYSLYIHTVVMLINFTFRTITRAQILRMRTARSPVRLTCVCVFFLFFCSARL